MSPPVPVLDASSYELRIAVLDVTSSVLTHRDQVVTVRIEDLDRTTTLDSGRYRAQVPRGALASVQILVKNPRFYSFSASFRVEVARDGLERWVRVEGGMANAVALGGQFIVDAFVVLRRTKRVDQQGGPILHPEQPDWFHMQLDERGPFRKGFQFPLLEMKDPIVSADQKSVGARRMTYDIQTPVRPLGRIYVFEYKTSTAPKLLFVWHTAAMDFSKASPGGSPGRIGYHFYFHPTPHAPEDYPYGTDKNGLQTHVFLGYRHLLFESWASVQHFYSRRRVVYVVPVGSPKDHFGEAGSAAGIDRILREVNLGIHVENFADASDYLIQDVGRVAVSGFSAGASFMLSALGTSSDPAGSAFMRDRLQEIYSWDGAIGGQGIPNTVPSRFAQLIRTWWTGEGKLFRVYTQNRAYDNELAFLRRYERTVTGSGGSYTKTWQKDGREFATLLVLPDSFFRHSYRTLPLPGGGFLFELDPLSVYRGNDSAESDPGFPAYQDTHHWFFKVFMYHALTHSGFEQAKS